MPETLLTPTGVKLYGRLVTDIVLVTVARRGALAAGATAAQLKDEPGMAEPEYTTLAPSRNEFLKKQLELPEDDDEKKIANVGQNIWV